MAYTIIAEGTPDNMIWHIPNVPVGTKIKLVTYEKLQNIPWLPFDECGIWDSWAGETIVGNPTDGYLTDIDVQCNSNGYGEINGIVAESGSISTQAIMPVIIVAGLVISVMAASLAGLYLVISGDLPGIADDVGKMFKWAAIGIIGIAVIITIKDSGTGKVSKFGSNQRQYHLERAKTSAGNIISTLKGKK